MAQTKMAEFSLAPVARVHSPFKEKFGIPRQPGLVADIPASIELLPPFNDPLTVAGLEQASHLWLVFIFDQCVQQGWKPSVRPPRLGGNQKMGVFATRAPFRPNHLGLSVVKLVGVRQEKGTVWIDIRGADLLDATPIVDIKPYVPYADSISDASHQMAGEFDKLTLPIIFSTVAQLQLQQPAAQQLALAALIEQVLRCDPRPAYQRGDGERQYGVRLHHWNVRWRIDDEAIWVDEIAIEKEQPDEQ